MPRLTVHLYAPLGSEDNTKLHEAGIFFRTDSSSPMTGRTFTSHEVLVEDGLDFFPAPLQRAFERAATEMNRHSLSDTLRFWKGGVAVADDCPDNGPTAVREITVPIDGYPDTTMKVEKYRPWVHPVRCFFYG